MNEVENSYFLFLLSCFFSLFKLFFLSLSSLESGRKGEEMKVGEKWREKGFLNRLETCSEFLPRSNHPLGTCGRWVEGSYRWMGQDRTIRVSARLQCAGNARTVSKRARKVLRAQGRTQALTHANLTWCDHAQIACMLVRTMTMSQHAGCGPAGYFPTGLGDFSLISHFPIFFIFLSFFSHENAFKQNNFENKIK